MKRRWIILIAVPVIPAVGAACLWWLARTAPSWYEPLDPADARVAEMAEGVEYGLVAEFHRIRPDAEPWTLRIREEYLNAWLASRMPEWIAHEDDLNWPEEFSAPQIRVGEDGIDLAVEVDIDGARHVLVTRVNPEVRDGRLELTFDRVGIGRVALPGAPAGKLLDLVDGMAPGGVLDPVVIDTLRQALGAGAGLDLGSHLELPDGRRVELLDLLARDGALDVTSRTLPPGKNDDNGDSDDAASAAGGEDRRP